VGIRQVLEPHAAFVRIDRAPRGAGPEGIQVLMKKQLAQRIGRVVPVHERAGRMHRRGGLVEPRDDAVGDVLLPVSGGIARRWRSRLGSETISAGRPGDDSAERENEGRAATATPGRQRG